jgi:hypothetical protein
MSFRRLLWLCLVCTLAKIMGVFIQLTMLFSIGVELRVTAFRSLRKGRISLKLFHVQIPRVIFLDKEQWA